MVGAGMIGLLTLQVLREAGCSRILVTDIDDTRLALAKKLGATDIVNGKRRMPLANFLGLLPARVLMSRLKR